MTHHTSDSWPIYRVTCIISIKHITAARSQFIYNQEGKFEQIQFWGYRNGKEAPGSKSTANRLRFRWQIRKPWAWTVEPTGNVLSLFSLVWSRPCWWLPCVMYHRPYGSWRAAQRAASPVNKRKKKSYSVKWDYTPLVWDISVGNRLH